MSTQYTQQRRSRGRDKGRGSGRDKSRDRDGEVPLVDKGGSGKGDEGS